MPRVSEIKLIRTDTTLDLSQKAEKVCPIRAEIRPDKSNPVDVAPRYCVFGGDKRSRLALRHKKCMRTSSHSTTTGFEPAQGDPSGLAVHRLNRSATLSLPGKDPAGIRRHFFALCSLDVSAPRKDGRGVVLSPFKSGTNAFRTNPTSAGRAARRIRLRIMIGRH